MGSKQEVSRYPGQPLAVCADCGARVSVPAAAGIPPFITHEAGCGREGWPVSDAIKYEDGLTATVNDWPNGIDHATGKDIAEPDQTDARAYVETSARGLIEDLRVLAALSEYESSEEARQDIGAERIAGLGLDPDAFDRYNAEEAIDQLPLAVEATTTFEVVLGTGGPDRRLCFECASHDQGADNRPMYEIRRVFYRYSWEGSAEVELTGEDRETAEAFGRRVVPELGE